MPYNLYLALTKPSYISAEYSHLDKGSLIYLHQNNKTIGSRILAPYIEDDNTLLANIENILFVATARLLAQLSGRLNEQLDLHQNLHIRIESISKGACLYDSSDLGIPSNNKTLCCGTTEKSFISFILTHCALWKKFKNNIHYDQDYMFRKYLHLGGKVSSFDALIDYPGSILWHALHGDNLPMIIDSAVYYQEELNPDIPF